MKFEWGQFECGQLMLHYSDPINRRFLFIYFFDEIKCYNISILYFCVLMFI